MAGSLDDRFAGLAQQLEKPAGRRVGDRKQRSERAEGDGCRRSRGSNMGSRLAEALAAVAASAAKRVLPAPAAPASTNATGSTPVSSATMRSSSTPRPTSGISPVISRLTVTSVAPSCGSMLLPPLPILSTAYSCALPPVCVYLATGGSMPGLPAEGTQAVRRHRVPVLVVGSGGVALVSVAAITTARRRAQPPLSLRVLAPPRDAQGRCRRPPPAPAGPCATRDQ